MKKMMKLGAWLVPCVVLMLGAGAAQAGDLPAGYKAIEYIESTKGGGQFIDTGYTANGQTRVVFDAVVPVRWEHDDRFGVLFGSRTMNDWSVKAFALQMCDGNLNVDTVRFAYNGAYRQDGSKPFPFGERVTVTCDGRHVEWTGSKAASVAFDATALVNSKSTLYIFADNTVSNDGEKNSSGLNHSVMRLYSFTIYEGETPKRNFVPCVRIEDAVAGLYDTVEGKFYGNIGSGNFGMSNDALPFGRELSGGIYEITESCAFAALPMESALKVADGASVVLKIAKGATVTLRGGDAFEVWGAGAGIEVPASATLCVMGAGKLVAYGGKAANGRDGIKGGDAISDESAGNFTSGAGGAGGWGGGGAGAGIGGRGGSGGGGGNGGKSVTGYNWSYTDISGNSGDNGGNGKNGVTCGAVYIEETVTVIANGGAAGDANGAGGRGGTWFPVEGSTYYFCGDGSGGGGGGAKGGAAQDIGSGGGGGYGGGGGGSGAYYSRFTWSSFYDVPGRGEGGYGAENGYPQPSGIGAIEGVHGGSGGAKGASGTFGNCRSLTIAESATVVAENLGSPSVMWISENNDYFLMEQDKLYYVASGIRSEIGYSTVEENTSTLGNGWYVVKGSVSRGTITVNGAAKLILWEGGDLKVTGGGNQPGLAVAPGNTIEIFGAPTGSGTLTANGGDNSAGIGGGNEGVGGTVIINGGTVTANGGYYGAGIGGGYRGAGGTVIINGGTVTANGGLSGAGIGGGREGAGGTVTINGGTVTVYGNYGGESIGFGAKGTDSGSLTLGSHVRKIDNNHYREGVLVSFEIPSGLSLNSFRTDGGPLIMTEDGASRTAFFLPGQYLTLGFQAPNFACRLEGDAEVSFGPFFGDCVIGASMLPRAVGIESFSIDYTLPNGETARAKNVYPLYSTGFTMPMEQDCWYVVMGEVTTATIEVSGVANLILADGAKLTVNGGIGVGVGTTLNIYGQSVGTGMLIAKGAKYCAGIGGRNPNNSPGYGGCGTVTINGGIVTAYGGTDSAGIGGGRRASNGNVTINGGTVTAYGGEDSGAGIGSGYGGWGGNVTINGGTVTATGGEMAAGIGGGYVGTDANMTLGENVSVVEGAVGNGNRYVKIAPIIDVWKAEVETFGSNWYVTVPNNAYINTHFAPNSNTRVAMDVNVQTANEYWFGCWDGNWNDRAFALGNDGSTVYCGYGSGNTTCGGIAGIIPSGRVTVALEKGVVYTNGDIWSDAHEDTDTVFALNHNLYLFAQNRIGTATSCGGQERIVCYGCSIWTNDMNGAAVLVRNFVPARTKDAKQVVGLYDTVSGDFYAPHVGTLTLGCDPACEGGTIEKVNENWVVTPNTGVEAVTITDLPEEAVLAVKLNGYNVPSGAFMGWSEDGKTFSLALNPQGVANGAKVTPVIGDLDDGEPFVVGKDEVTLTIRTIPGLKYSLIRGSEIGSITDTVVQPTLATEAQMPLTDPTPLADKAFYKVKVGK